ncbi:MAG: choice-of-anchor U domain-containing protein, partial [Psychrobium sp.]
TNEIIDLVNQRITTIPAAQLPLTSEQLQVIIDEVSSLYAINKVITTGEGSSTITVTDFENINVVGVTSENLAAVLALLLQQPSELTIEQIQTLVNQVNALKVINDFITSPDDSTRSTITDFDTLNISGVTTENIELILNMLALQTAPLTAEEIQSLIDELLALAKINQYSTSGGISEEPSLSDFADITINSLSDETYQQLLDALVDEPAIRSIADIKALIATLAQGDSDNDGLSNALEAELGSDPNDANSPFADGAGDSDNDGVSNAIEGHLDNLGGATLPQTTLSTDSDGDGLPDVLELAKGFDPLDANDPTTNGDELATNGLSNAVNAYLVELGLAVNGEIDKRNDYDRDGYNDALEIALGSDPQSSNDKDVDLDGVPDVVEAFLTSTINDGTDTKTLDLNSNGLSDAYEVRQAATLSELRQLLEAKEQVDSDGDGISDAVEAFITGDDNDLSVTPTSDADNDGIADVDEILAGSNPLRNDIPVLWIETTMLSDTTLMLDTYFGGLPSSKVSYAWQLTSLTGVGMNVSATDVKQPQVTNLVGGLYLISVTVTRDINGEQLASTATHVVNIDSVGELAVKDSDGDGVADNVDSDNGNTGAEETIPTKIEASDTFKMVTDNGVKLRLGVVAVLSGQNGSEVSEENVQKFGNGQGQAVSADLANDEGFEHIDTFDYEAVNLPQAGASINVFIPLSEPVPEQASLRKFNPTDGWKPYDTSEGDSFATAPAISEGICSNDIADYSADLTVGDMCLLLVISDGGNNDADGEINGMIQDPVAVSAPEKSDPVTPPTPKPPVEPPEPNYQTGTKGGSMSVILLLLLSAMLLARTRRVI